MVFKRCKQGNQKRLAEMIAAGKLEVLLSSNVPGSSPRMPRDNQARGWHL